MPAARIALEVNTRLASLTELVRAVGQVRDFDSLRQFELTALQQMEGLSISVHELLKEQDDEARKLAHLKSQLEKVARENHELGIKYKQTKQQIREMEEEVTRTRAESSKTASLMAQKQAEIEQARSHASFLSADLKEKQRELLLLVQMQERLQGTTPKGNSDLWKKAGPQPSSPKAAALTVAIQSPRSRLTRKSSSQFATLASQDREGILWSEAVTHNHVMGDRVAIALTEAVFLRDRRDLVDELKTLNFDMFSVGEEDLLCLLEDMFLNIRTLDVLKIEEKKLRAFLLGVHKSYRGNPFHNFLHAFSVTQMMFFFLVGAGVGSKFQDLDIVLLMISALCHDLDHPGLNNVFQIKSKSNLAFIFQDESVLEAYHSSCTFYLLNNPDTDLLSGLDPPQAKVARSTIRDCILCTDMALHFKYLGQLTSLESLDVTQIAHRQLIYGMLLKCADISNEIRPFNICKKWALNLYEEFTTQGDLERARGLPVTPMCDREAIVLTKMQTGFIDNILRPAFRAVARHLPELAVCVDSLDANRKKWQLIEDAGGDINHSVE